MGLRGRGPSVRVRKPMEGFLIIAIIAVALWLLYLFLSEGDQP